MNKFSSTAQTETQGDAVQDEPIWVSVLVLRQGNAEVPGFAGVEWSFGDAVQVAWEEALEKREKERGTAKVQALRVEADHEGNGYRRTELREQAARAAVALQQDDEPLMTAAEVREARHALGMGRMEFAAALGVDEKSTYKWEMGIRSPNEESTARIEALLAGRKWFEREPGKVEGRRGRPPGSKNRPKQPQYAVEALRSMERAAGMFMGVGA